MRIRFQADADIDPDIRKGLLRREPSIDFRSAAGVIPDGTLDPDVLRIAAGYSRVLVSADLRTMRVHFEGFVAAALALFGKVVPLTPVVAKFYIAMDGTGVPVAFRN